MPVYENRNTWENRMFDYDPGYPWFRRSSAVVGSYPASAGSSFDAEPLDAVLSANFDSSSSYSSDPPPAPDFSGGGGDFGGGGSDGSW